MCALTLGNMKNSSLTLAQIMASGPEIYSRCHWIISEFMILFLSESRISFGLYNMETVPLTDTGPLFHRALAPVRWQIIGQKRGCHGKVKSESGQARNLISFNCINSASLYIYLSNSLLWFFKKKINTQCNSCFRKLRYTFFSVLRLILINNCFEFVNWFLNQFSNFWNLFLDLDL